MRFKPNMNFIRVKQWSQTESKRKWFPWQQVSVVTMGIPQVLVTVHGLTFLQNLQHSKIVFSDCTSFV